MGRRPLLTALSSLASLFIIVALIGDKSLGEYIKERVLNDMTPYWVKVVDGITATMFGAYWHELIKWLFSLKLKGFIVDTKICSKNDAEQTILDCVGDTQYVQVSVESKIRYRSTWNFMNFICNGKLIVALDYPTQVELQVQSFETSYKDDAERRRITVPLEAFCIYPGAKEDARLMIQGQKVGEIPLVPSLGFAAGNGRCKWYQSGVFWFVKVVMVRFEGRPHIIKVRRDHDRLYDVQKASGD